MHIVPQILSCFRILSACIRLLAFEISNAIQCTEEELLVFCSNVTTYILVDWLRFNGVSTQSRS